MPTRVTAWNQLGLGGRGNRSVSFSGQNGYTVVETWEAHTDFDLSDSNDGWRNPLWHEGDSSVPQRYSVHPYQSGLYLTEIAAIEQDADDPTIFRFDLKYESAVGVSVASTDPAKEKNYNPSLVKKSWSFSKVQVPRRPSPVDDGQGFTTASYPVMSTVGEAMNATEDLYLPVCNYTRHETATPSSILTAVGAVNSGTVTIDGISCAARTVLLSNVAVGETQFDGTNTFRVIQYTLTLNALTHDLYVPSRGLNVNKVVDGAKAVSRATVFDPTEGVERPVSSPVLHTFTGGGGATPEANLSSGFTNAWDAATDTAADVHIRRYMHPNVIDFSGFGFS